MPGSPAKRTFCTKRNMHTWPVCTPPPGPAPQMPVLGPTMCATLQRYSHWQRSSRGQPVPLKALLLHRHRPLLLGPKMPYAMTSCTLTSQSKALTFLTPVGQCCRAHGLVRTQQLASAGLAPLSSPRPTDSCTALPPRQLTLAKAAVSSAMQQEVHARMCKYPACAIPSSNTIQARNSA